MQGGQIGMGPAAIFALVLAGFFTTAVTVFLLLKRQPPMSQPPPTTIASSPTYKHDLRSVDYYRPHDLVASEETEEKREVFMIKRDIRDAPLPRCPGCGVAVAYLQEKCPRCGFLLKTA